MEGTKEIEITQTIPRENQSPRDYKEDFSNLEKNLTEENVPLTPHLEKLGNKVKEVISKQITEYSEEDRYFVKHTILKCTEALLRKSDLEGEQKLEIINILQIIVQFIVQMIPFDYIEPLVVLSRLFAPGYAFFLINPKAKDPTADRLRKELLEQLNSENEILNSTHKVETENNPPQQLVSQHSIFVKFQKGDNLCPIYYFQIINHFGKLKGFDSIVRRLESEHRIHLDFARCLIRPLVNAREFLKPSFLEIWLPIFQKSVFNYLLEWTGEELKKEDRATFIEIGIQVQQLFSVVWSDSKLDDIVESFNLTVALKSFLSSNLEKSLRGLKYIKKIVSRASVKENKTLFSTFSMFTRPEEKETEIKPIDPKFVIAWLKENSIIDHICKLTTHPEIIKQSISIFVFLANNSLLEVNHLIFLWESTLGKHESVKHTIYTSMIDLAPCLSLELINALFERMKKVPLSEYDLETLNVVYLFTITALSKINNSTNNQKNYYGLDIFYQLSSQDHGILPTVIDNAFKSFIELLEKPECQSQRQQYMENCIENIKNNKSVPQSLRLLEKIIETFGSKKKKSTIEHLQSKSKILNHFFDNLIKSSTVNSNNNTIESTPHSSTNDQAAPTLPRPEISRYSLEEQTMIRLSFLEFILLNSTLELSKDEVNCFWDVFITQANSPQERENVFHWLETSQLSNRGSSYYGPFNESHWETLFCDKVTSLDFINLSKAGFNVFEKFFLLVNEKLGKIKRIAEKKTNGSDSFFALTSDLTGIEHLWIIVLDNPNTSVFTLALQRLNSLYQYFGSDSLKKKYVSLREEHIARCIKYLTDSVQNPQQTENRILRILTLLTGLILDFENATEKKTQSSSKEPQNSNSMKPITVTVHTDRGGVWDLTFLPTDSIRALKLKVAERYGFSTKSLRFLLSDGRELKDESKNLQEFKFTEKQKLFVKKKLEQKKEMESSLPEPDLFEDFREAMISTGLSYILKGFGIIPPNFPILQQLEQNQQQITPTGKESVGAQKGSPQQILSTPENFEQFYNLMNFSDAIGGKVWELLNLLPKSESLSDKISSLQNPDWTQLLDQKFTFKLTYTLQIIDEIILNKDKDNQQSKSWCDKFVESGGLTHLINTLLSIPSDQTKSGTQRCFALLLKIINYLTLGENFSFKTTFQSNFSNQTVNLCEKLLSITLVYGNISSLEKNSHSKENMIQQVACEFIKYALQLLTALLLSNEACLNYFYKFHSLKDWLQCLILSTPQSQIRKEIVHFIEVLSKQTESKSTKHPSVFFLSLLFSFLEQVEDQGYTSSQCQEYFYITKKLLQECDKGALINSINEEETSQWNYLLKKLFYLITCHKVRELSPTSEPDNVIIGLLNLVRTLIKKDPSVKNECNALVKEIFQNCLFELPNAENRLPPKCKARASREAAFRLLIELCSDVYSNFSELTQLILGQIQLMDTQFEWSYMPFELIKSPLGYVGLQNQGATCYMNSLLQQLFVIPQFRNGILSAEDKSPIPSESVLYQIQYLFAFLQESEKCYYNTIPFCRTIKDSEGRPINTLLQMDCNEFSNTLFDKLENLLKNSPQEKLLTQVFGGQLTNQLICKECPHGSACDEAFYTLSVEVQRQKKLYDSLELFVQGEMLVGDNKYFCDKCQKGVDTLKRSCLKTLPNYLLIHLKRFEFDYEKMKNFKVNDSCEFPFLLNVEPYTAEGLARRDAQLSGNEPAPMIHPLSYYDYELTGIVVHIGTTDSGHYISFIKDPLSEAKDPKEARWFEFNDARISPFDPNLIPEIAFGGVEECQELDRQTGKTVTVKRPKSQNAYILVYRKIHPNNEQSNSTSEETKTNLNQPSKIPDKILQSIWEENSKFLREQHIFSSEYFSFIWTIVNSCPQLPDEASNENTTIDSLLLTIQLSTRFLLLIYSHFKEKTLFSTWMSFLKQMYSKSPKACVWLLEAFRKEYIWVRHMFVSNPIDNVRIACAELLVHVVTLLEPSEKETIKRYLTERENPAITSTIIDFVNHLVSVEKLQLLNQFPRYCAQYFLVIRDISKISFDLAKLFIYKKTITKLIDLALGVGTFTPISLNAIPSRLGSQQMVHLLESVQYLICCCKTNIQPDQPYPPTLISPDNIISFLSDEELYKLYETQFLSKMMRDTIHYESCEKLALHLSWRNKKLSKIFIQIISEGIERGSTDQYGFYFRLITALLKLEDSLHDWRVDAILCAQIPIIDDPSFKKEFADAYVSHFEKLMNDEPHVKVWVQTHHQFLKEPLEKAGWCLTE